MHTYTQIHRHTNTYIIIVYHDPERCDLNDSAKVYDEFTVII